MTPYSSRTRALACSAVLALAMTSAEPRGPDLPYTQPGTRNEAMVFSADGTLLAWARLSPGDPNWDIMAMNPSAPGSRRVVLEGEGAVRPLDISPDGRRILVERYLSSTHSERWLLEIDTGKMTNLFPGQTHVSFEGGEFTTDGRKVILATDMGRDLQRLIELDLSSAAITELTPQLRWGIEAFDLSPDGRLLAYVVNADGYSTVAVWDRVRRKPLRPPQLPAGVLTRLEFSPDSSQLAIGLTTPSSSGDVWSWTLGRATLGRWTESELGELDRAHMVEPSLVHVRSFDGVQVPAFVYRPKHAAAKTPVIVQIHGGPEGQARPRFNATYQYWVNELGATVIQPNVRGSKGYGRTYLALDDAEKREDAVRDIGAVLDWLAAQPDLDADRVVVHGASYGGFMVLASLARYAGRLAGAVDIVGFSNFISFLANTEGYRANLRRAEYGDERDPTMRAFLERISPLNHSSLMRKPLLVIQGANDPRVPKSESDQLVKKLRAQGEDVWYLVAQDEGHGFRKKHNEDAQRAVEAMFLRKVFRLTGAQ